MVLLSGIAALVSASLAVAKPLPPSVAALLPNDFVLAPLITPPAPGGASVVDSHILSDSYIVVLDDHLESHHVDAHHAHVHGIHQADMRVRALKAADASSSSSLPAQLEGIKHRFSLGGKHAHTRKRKVHGYTGHFSESTLDAIRALKGVKYVERDSIVTASDVERGAPWGLARISHRKPLGFGTFNRYEYDGKGGEGVDAYVVDTGVNINHIELEGRAKWGKTIPKDPDQDLNGHGSHVAGTIASAKYGVAKLANIVAVKVLGANGSGSMADVVSGVSWAADAAYSKALKKDPKHKGSVANMSLGGGKSPTLDDAVDAAVEDGLHFAVAAGNDNKDACNYSPAASKNAVTVGASTIADERAYFSNHGKCVDVFAPGLNILSIWNTGNSSINTISGTSMASPHVAGLMAYFVSLYPTSFNAETDDFLDEVYERVLGTYTAPSPVQFVFNKVQRVWSSGLRRQSALAAMKEKPLTPAVLKKALLSLASKGRLADEQASGKAMPAGTPNLLIFNNFTSSA